MPVRQWTPLRADERVPWMKNHEEKVFFFEELKIRHPSHFSVRLLPKCKEQLG
jgi:hypothetical protein